MMKKITREKRLRSQGLQIINQDLYIDYTIRNIIIRTIFILYIFMLGVFLGIMLML